MIYDERPMEVSSLKGALKVLPYDRIVPCCI